MNATISIHDVSVEDVIRLIPVHKSLRVWRRTWNDKFYYSCQVDLTSGYNVTMFTEDLDETVPELAHADEEVSSR